MIFLSQLLGKPVHDSVGKRVGKVRDLIVAPQERFPRVVALMMWTRGGPRAISFTQVDRIEREWVLAAPEALLTDYQESPHDLRLNRDVMDKQIIDIRNLRVVRVNDLAFLEEEWPLLLAGVDTSLRGLLRHFGVERVGAGLARLLRLPMSRRYIPWNQVEVLQGEEGGVIKLKVPVDKLARLHPADLAGVVHQLDPDERAEVFERLDVETAADALEEIETEVGASIIENLEEERAAEILSEMEYDEAADILGDMEPEDSQELLELMEQEDAQEIKHLMSYDEHTAGGIMTTDCVEVPITYTAQQVIDHLRSLEERPAVLYYVYAVNEEGRLVGVCSLGELVTAPPQQPIAELIVTEVIRVSPDMEAEEVAQIIAKYDLVAAPVVDVNERLLGVVTVDDVVESVLPPDWKQHLPRVFGSARAEVPEQPASRA